ncbi:MAG: hypothetical protein ACK5TG_22215 [Planctomyces sp.]
MFTSVGTSHELPIFAAGGVLSHQLSDLVVISRDTAIGGKAADDWAGIHVPCAAHAAGVMHASL